MRRRDQADIPPALNSNASSIERMVSGTDDEYQTIDPSAKRKQEQAHMYQQYCHETEIKQERKNRPDSAQSSGQKRNVRKRTGKSASHIRQKIEESGINSTQKRKGEFKEDA